jgi:hypothetical protein
MNRTFSRRKLVIALALCGITLASPGAQAAYVYRVAVPGLKAANQISDSTSTASLNFGNLALGSTSPPQTVQLTNTGNTLLSIGRIFTAGSYASSQNCGPTLGVNASCLVNVTFTPEALNANSGDLFLVTNAGTQTVTLTGFGQEAILALSPASLSFGNVTLGSSSTAQTFTLTNNGNIAATGLGISPSSGFTDTTTCGSSLAAGASCTVSTIFTPGAAGAVNGQVSVTSANAASATETLSGTGGTVTLAANAVNFGTVNDYSTNTQSLTLTNSGTGTATPTFSAANGAYTVSGCASIPAGGNCTATVTLNTTGAGSYNSTLTIGGGTSGSITANLTATSQKVIQSFTTDGTTSWSVPARVTQVAVLVVGGGGGGEQSGGPTGAGFQGGSGGGGGQVVFNANYSVTPGAAVSVTVGVGGDAGPDVTENGGASVFGSLTAAGGKSGFEGNASGSGTAGGVGCTPTLQGGGGGGQGGAGGAGTTTTGGVGGAGVANSITGTTVFYGGGGGGATAVPSSAAIAAGGVGGGGAGGNTTVSGIGGAPNTGGGAGGGGGGGRGAGGDGIVVISY